MKDNGKIAVVAVGGNSLIVDKNHQSAHDQYKAACKTVEHITDMIEEGYNVIITHGNGPQVGFALLRSELARDQVDPMPLDYCGADTQGSIGYSFQKALNNEFKKRSISKRVATVVTQVLVDKNDPSFSSPSKPVGQFYSEAEAKERRDKSGWDITEDAGRGWRRVVASPQPIEIIEQSAIKLLADSGFTVVAVGGGGIPVVKNADGELEGTAAVIDKDFASSLLASNIKADLFVISTAVEKACLNFGKPDEKMLDTVSASELEKYCEEGHFKPGSMLPKCQAIIKFLKNGGSHAIITNPENLGKAIKKEAGTHIYP